MKINLIPVLTLSLLAMAAGCNNKSNQKSKTTSGIPACLASQIETFSKKDAVNPPVQIDEYQYKGQTVYLFTADCCDQFNTVYDSACAVICSPSGGITGSGDGKCPDFSKEAKLVKKIWEKKDAAAK